MSTPRRREHGDTSAAGMPASGGAPKTFVFHRKHENGHRAQARAHFPKCAPRAGESSILPTQDGAHDHVSKQNEHRAGAGAPFSIKKCTVHTREAQKVKRNRESAPAAASRTLQISVWTRLMSAAPIASDDFAIDMHLDSAGDRFGAAAQGSPRQHILRVGEKCQTVARKGG